MIKTEHKSTISNSPKHEKRKRGRPPSFDRQALVEFAMNKFWEHGYRNVSINELAADTGITRASIYNSFIGKDKLLLEALDYYMKDSPDNVLFDVRPGDSVLAAFKALFEKASKKRSADQKMRGCLAVNCLLELASQSDELGKTIREMFDKRRDLVKALMVQAVEQKEMQEPASYETQANLFMTFLYGLNVFAKTNNSEQALWELCVNFLKSLGFSMPITSTAH